MKHEDERKKMKLRETGNGMRRKLRYEEESFSNGPAARTNGGICDLGRGKSLVVGAR